MNAESTTPALADEQIEAIGRCAIIGNMNNNAFTMMRYFRDLGIDATAFCFSDDGIDATRHFAPAADTWHVERWQRFIRRLPVPNSNRAIVGRIWPPRLPVATRRVRECLAGFDTYIGSGISPALFERLGWRLDGFYPYSSGIEFIANPVFAAVARQNGLRGSLHRRVRAVQARGIRNARMSFNAEMGPTKDSFDALSVPFQTLAVPAVYNREPTDEQQVPRPLRAVIDACRSADLSILSAARHIWVQPATTSDADWIWFNKRNDWLISGVEEFAARNPRAKPLLILFEYGPDVEASKRLINQLGIEHFVHWLPTMPRREIRALLEHVHIGVGEFIGIDGLLWGGTGFETLAAGLPLMQSFNFSESEFWQNFGYPPPPVLDVKAPADVTRHLTAMAGDPAKRRAIGHASREWYDRNSGISMAARWAVSLADAQKNIR